MGQNREDDDDVARVALTLCSGVKSLPSQSFLGATRVPGVL